MDRVQDRNEMGLILCKDENGEKCLNYVGVIELEDNHMVYVSLGLSEKLLVSLMMQNSIFENNVQAIVNDNYDILLANSQNIDGEDLSMYGNEATLKGQDYIVFKSRSVVKPFSYVQMIPKEELFAPVYDYLKISVTIFLLLLMLAVLFELLV